MSTHERVWFMGPYSRVGYRLRFSDEPGRSDDWRGQSYSAPPNFPWKSMDRNEWGACGKTQGTPVMDYGEGWSILSVADYTVDRRLNVMAIFAVERSDLSKSEMKVLAWDRYPSVWKRLGVPTDNQERRARVNLLCRRLEALDVPAPVVEPIRQWALDTYPDEAAS